MLIPPQERQAFEQMCDAIAAYWAVHGAVPAADDEDVILVDLLHEDLNLLLGCLTAAKWEQTVRGGHLVGLTGQSFIGRIRSTGAYDLSTITRLAEAFGVGTFLALDAEGQAQFLEADPRRRPGSVRSSSASCRRSRRWISTRSSTTAPPTASSAVTC